VSLCLVVDLSFTSGVYLLGSALSFGKDTLSVAHRVSTGGNLSVSSPVSVVRG
jgi:hypothetical protein